MTHEESLMMWKIELDNFNKLGTDKASKDIKKLYEVLDKVITAGTITYEDFTKDMIDELTTLMVEAGKEGKELDRATEVDTICKRLTEKYEAKYNEGEFVEGDPELSTDNSQIQDESGVCEPECASEESRGNTTEIG